MFTGIITAKGKISAVRSLAGGIQLEIQSDTLNFSDTQLGDSIAVNGVCLTVVKFTDDHFVCDVSQETLRCSTFSFFKVNDIVNLEQALRPQDRLGGHWVSGHVDGMATVLNTIKQGESTQYIIKIPTDLMKYMAKKGSVCLDGVSLTVNEISANTISVNIIPHTLNQTNIANWQPQTLINVEVDLVARYLERLLMDYTADLKQNAGLKSIDKDFLAKHGFIKDKS